MGEDTIENVSVAEQKVADEKSVQEKEQTDESAQHLKSDSKDETFSAETKGLDESKGNGTEDKKEKAEDPEIPRDSYGYAGEKVDGMRHGKGSEYNSKGQIKYEGSWVKGIRSGSGKIYSRNGVVGYEGELLDGKKHGVGSEYDEQGTKVYEGPFLNGMRHGQSGKLFDEDGILRFHGSFFNGRKYGTGHSYCVNRKGTELCYIGLWSSTQCLIPDIILYHGEHIDGHPHGTGVEYEHSAGRKVEDEDLKKHDVLHFKGEFRIGRVNYGQGDIVYEGEFKNGKRHGKGFEYPLGKRAYNLSGGGTDKKFILEGSWVSGNMVGRPVSRQPVSLEEA